MRRVRISSQATSTGRIAFFFPLGAVYSTHTSKVCPSATTYSITSSVEASRLPFTCIRFSHARSPRADRYSALFAGGSSIRYFTYRPTVFTLGYSVHPRAAACASNAAYSSVTVGLFCENLRSNQMFSMIACCSAVSVGNVSFSRGFRHSASARK